MREQWRPVVGFDAYEVSDQGRVRSLPRLTVGRTYYPGCILKPTPHSKGHLWVRLYRGTRTDFKDRPVQQLVLEAFVGPRGEHAHSRHLNDIPSDNRLENLAWGSRSDNAYDSIRNGTHHMARRTECPRGHPYDSENTIIITRPDGTFKQRACRECGRIKSRNYQRKKRENSR